MATLHRDYWVQNEAQAVEFLDSLEVKDIYVFMTEGSEVSEIMNNIEEAYNTAFQEEYNTDLDLFEALNESEFQLYMELRFNSKFEEVHKTILRRF